MALDGVQKNKLVLLINGIVSIVIIAYILNYIGLNNFLNEISKVNLTYLGLSASFLLIMYGIMTARIKILLHEQGINLGWLQVLRSHFVGMLAADFTPARSGYFATSAMLHYKYKVPSEKALVSVMGPTIFDFATKAMAGAIGITFLLWQFLSKDNKVLLIGASILMISMTFVMILLLFSRKFLNLFSFTKSWPIVGKIYEVFHKMQDNSKAVVSKTPELLILLLFTWSAKAISWYFAAKSLGITIETAIPEILFYYLFQPLVTILEFIPSPTIAGIGLSEGGATLVLGLFGISAAKAAAFSLLTRFKTIAINLIAVPDAISLLLKPKTE